MTYLTNKLCLNEDHLFKIVMFQHKKIELKNLKNFFYIRCYIRSIQENLLIDISKISISKNIFSC